MIVENRKNQIFYNPEKHSFTPRQTNPEKHTFTPFPLLRPIEGVTRSQSKEIPHYGFMVGSHYGSDGRTFQTSKNPHKAPKTALIVITGLISMCIIKGPSKPFRPKSKGGSN